MVDAAHILVLAPRYVASAFELVRELLRPLAPTRSGEGDELAWNEIAGMRGHNVQEPGFVLGVAKRLDCADMFAEIFIGKGSPR